MSDQESGNPSSSISSSTRSKSLISLTESDSLMSRPSLSSSQTTITTYSCTSISTSSLTSALSSIATSSFTPTLEDLSQRSSGSIRTLRSGRSLTPSHSSHSSRSSSSRSSSSGKSEKSQGRKKPSVLIDPIEEIVDTKLPSYRQVIGFFLHLHSANRDMTLDQIADTVYQAINKFYVILSIPTKSDQTIKKNIRKLYLEFQGIKNSVGRDRAMYDSEKIKLANFNMKLDNLYDISQPDASIDDETVRTFLINQRKPGRPGTMSSLGRRRRPSKLVEQIDLPPQVDESEELPSNFERTSPVEGTSEVASEADNEEVFTSTSSSPAKDEDKSPDFIYILVEERHKHRIDFISTDMVAAMDSCKTSNPCVMRLLVPTLKALKLDPNDYVLSVTTLRKRRQSKRGEAFLKIQTAFINYVTEGRRLVKIHCDGKAVQNITDKKLEERVAVKAVCDDKEQILGCPVSGRKGIDVANTVYKLIHDWELDEFVTSLCFDTTYVNSGRKQGAAIRLERKLGKQLQFFPCRHHIYELHLRLVYEFFMGETKSDVVKLFGTFKKAWETIDKKQYTAGISDKEVSEALNPQLRAQMKDFIKSRMQNKIFRSDYREFLELALLFIGEKLEKPEGQVIFHPPGADHHARWMAKAIYALKIFMFRDQFAEHLNAEELAGLRQVCIFLIKHYLKSWFRCPIAAEAPFQDFNFMKAVLLDKALHKDLVPKIITKMGGHLWYLDEETVALSFFDSNISEQMKEDMVQRLQLDGSEYEEDETVVQNGHRVVVDTKTITVSYMTKKFSDFVTPNTINFFERFQIPTAFLREPPKNWFSIESYQKGLDIVKELKVTNDTAERTVQLMSAYVGVLTKSDPEYQELVMVTDEYHKKYPTALKRDLVK